MEAKIANAPSCRQATEPFTRAKVQLALGLLYSLAVKFSNEKTAKHITPRLDTAECLLQFSPSHLR